MRDLHPKQIAPIGHLYYVGNDAGGFGLGTQQAVDSAIYLADMILSLHVTKRGYPVKKLGYDPDNHGSFDQAWGIHRKCKEWWYVTGTLTDEDGNLYSCQFTLLHLCFK